MERTRTGHHHMTFKCGHGDGVSATSEAANGGRPLDNKTCAGGGQKDSMANNKESSATIKPMPEITNTESVRGH